MPGIDFPLQSLIAANLVMAIAATLQASIGIGLALLAVPLLALLDPQLVPGPMLLAGSVLALSSAIRERRAVNAALMGWALLGLLLGTLIAVFALSRIDTTDLSRVFAVLILLAVAISIASPRIPATNLTLLAGSGFSGLMGTMAGIHGPAVALVLQNARPEQARAMMGALFFIAYLGSVAALANIGLFGLLHLKLSAALLPGVLAGIAIAPRIARFVSPSRLRAAILAISFMSALLLLLR